MKNIISRLKENVVVAKLISIAKQFIVRIYSHRVNATSAQIAYFVLLSLFPFVIVLLNIVSRVTLIHADSINELLELLPNEVSSVITAVIADLQLGFGSRLQLVIFIAGALYFASLGVKPMIYSANLAFGSDKRRSGIMIIVLGLLFTAAFLALLMMVFATNVLGEQLVSAVFDYFGIREKAYDIWYIFKVLITPIYIVAIIYLLNYFSLPKALRTTVKFEDLIFGAIFSAVAMLLGSRLFTFQVARTERYALTYGSISGVIIMLAWLYLMGMLIVLGFEINGMIYEYRTDKKQ